MPPSFDKTPLIKHDTASGASDSEQASALLVAAAGQLSLAYGMRVIGPGSSVIQERAGHALTDEFTSLKNFFPTVADGIKIPSEALTAAKSADLLPPLMILGSASYTALNLGKSFYDFQLGNKTKSDLDMSNACQGMSATLGSIIGFVAAERYGIPKWVGTSAGTFVGGGAYKLAEYLSYEGRQPKS